MGSQRVGHELLSLSLTPYRVFLVPPIVKNLPIMCRDLEQVRCRPGPRWVVRWVQIPPQGQRLVSGGHAGQEPFLPALSAAVGT